MGAPHQHGVVDIAINFPLPAARRSLILWRGYQLGAALVDWRTRRPIPTGSLAELYELPLQAIDWWVALEVPPDLVPGSYVEPMQLAPGSSLGYVTLSVRVEVGWRVDLPSVIVAPGRFWFGEAGELLGEAKARPLVHLMPSHGWQLHQALKHGRRIDPATTEAMLRSMPREFRDHLLKTLRRPPARRGIKSYHDPRLIIAEVWNAFEHRGIKPKEHALRAVAKRRNISTEAVRKIFAHGDGGDLPVWVTAPNEF